MVLLAGERAKQLDRFLDGLELTPYKRFCPQGKTETEKTIKPTSLINRKNRYAARGYATIVLMTIMIPRFSSHNPVFHCS